MLETRDLQFDVLHAGTTSLEYMTESKPLRIIVHAPNLFLDSSNIQNSDHPRVG